ncbi:hypothetical protein QOT17_005419 [Balamuthia mandrillaris]
MEQALQAAKVDLKRTILGSPSASWSFFSFSSSADEQTATLVNKLQLFPSSSFEKGEEEGEHNDIKVTVLQLCPLNGERMAAGLDGFLAQQERVEGRKADVVIFPENSLSDVSYGEPALETCPALRPIAHVCEKHSVFAVAGTMHEYTDRRSYVTSVVIGDDGSILGYYRKRKPTHEGAHHPGDKVGVWDTSRLGRIATMICFDIENEDVLFENLQHQPDLLLNPTWIAAPRSVMRSALDPLALSTWQTSQTTMARLFEERCSSASPYPSSFDGEDREADERKRRGGMTVVRCDIPFPLGQGTSQVIGPSFTVRAPEMSQTHFSVILPKRTREEEGQEDQENRIYGFRYCLTPPERERTERKDRTGSRYTVSYCSGHSSAIYDFAFVDPMMKVLTASADGSLKLWNVNTSHCMHTLKSPSSMAFLSIALQSPVKAWSSGLDGVLRRWDLTKGQQDSSCSFNTVKDETTFVWRLLMQQQEEEQRIYCGDTKGRVHVMDPNVSTLVHSFGGGETDCCAPIRSLAGVGDDLIAVAVDNVLQVWEARNTSKPLFLLSSGSSPVSSIQRIPASNKARFLSASWDGFVSIWDLPSSSSNEEQANCLTDRFHSGHKSAITDITVINESKFITSSMDRTMRLLRWNEEKEEEEEQKQKTSRSAMHVFTSGHMQPIYRVGYNGKDRVGSCGEDGRWALWRFTQDMFPADLAKKLVEK